MEREIGGWGGGGRLGALSHIPMQGLHVDPRANERSRWGGAGSFSLTFMVTHVNISCGIVLKSMVNS